MVLDYKSNKDKLGKNSPPPPPIIRNHENPNDKERIMVDRLMHSVKEVFGFDALHLYSATCGYEVKLARKACYYILSMQQHMSLSKIACLFGKSYNSPSNSRSNISCKIKEVYALLQAEEDKSNRKDKLLVNNLIKKFSTTETHD